MFFLFLYVHLLPRDANQWKWEASVNTFARRCFYSFFSVRLKKKFSSTVCYGLFFSLKLLWSQVAKERDAIREFLQQKRIITVRRPVWKGTQRSILIYLDFKSNFLEYVSVRDLINYVDWRLLWIEAFISLILFSHQYVRFVLLFLSRKIYL